MRNLLQEIKANKEFLPRKPALFLDYDGTLTPIVSHEQKALLEEKARNNIRALRKLLPLVAIVSGRSLRNVREKVGIKGLIYVGNHGLEIQGRGLEKKVLIPGFYSARRKIKSGLTPILEKYKGAFLEDKGLSLSIHYRNVEPKYQKFLLRQANDFLEKFHHLVILRRGKKILEIRQRVDWDKGKAVDWILRHTESDNLIPIYLGDDLTDEDAFRLVKRKGISCLVGNKKATQADFCLASPKEVLRFLERLVEHYEKLKASLPTE